MREFAQLYARLDASTSLNAKVAAMRDHFAHAAPQDAAWTVYFLAGGRPRRLVPTAVLREALLAHTGLPLWLFESCYQSVGDLAETIALLLEEPGSSDARGLDAWMRESLLPLRGMEAAAQRDAVRALWCRLDAAGRFAMNKLITGGLRVGVSRQLVMRALAAAFEADEHQLAMRMIGYTAVDARPDAQAFLALIGAASASQGQAAHGSSPYPFFLAHPLQQPPESLGEPADWIAEWKWDGIRAQLVRRPGVLALWSRGEELVTERFPEVIAAAQGLPSHCVLDGELLAWSPGAQAPQPFARLQTRISRQRLSPRQLREAPVRFLAYDLLEDAQGDLRRLGTRERRERLEALMAQLTEPTQLTQPIQPMPPMDPMPLTQPAIGLSPRLEASHWEALAALRAQSRERGVEGLMLKRADAAYGAGRTRSDPRGDWWKWKIEPYSIDAVLIYAQAGHGRRANLYTDYTFALWDGPPQDGGKLVPFAKAYSGLSDAEIRQTDAVIRRTTRERFGPVRSVEPTLVFELGFEAVARSSRHRCGVAVRFPRILRPRPDKRIDEADRLETLLALID